MKIKQDAFGVYGQVGGWIVRPWKPTRFKVGDNPKAAHFGGSPRAGVGKDETCARGKYLETWFTCQMVGEPTSAGHIAWHRMRVDDGVDEETRTLGRAWFEDYCKAKAAE